jgi:hypothetical protein
MRHNTIALLFCSALLVRVAPAAAASVSEQFDGVTAPALPAGWPTNYFITVSTSSPSAPNHAFIADVATMRDSFLDTPSLPVTGPLQVRFKHRYDTEDGYDGGVLEVSYDGGAFIDVTDAGGEFISGAYNGLIVPLIESSTNPLAHRRGWTGDSTSYVTTVIDLPAAATNVKFRFRFGTDGGTAGNGWGIDDFELTDGCVLTCPSDVTADASPNTCGASATFGATEHSNCGAVLTYPPSGSLFDVGATTVTTVSEAGPFCTFTVTVTDNQAPTITCPGDISIMADPGACEAKALFVPPVGLDNCTSTSECDVTPGDVLQQGTTTITCTVSDATAKSASCSFNLTVDVPESDKGAACDQKNQGGCAATGGAAAPLLVVLAALSTLRRRS